MGEKKWEGCTRKGRKERTRKRRSTAREEEEEEEAGEQQIQIHGSKALWLGSCQDFSAHFNYPVPYLLIYRRRMEVVLLRRSCRGKETVTKYAVLSRKRCIIDAELALPLTVCRPRGGELVSASQLPSHRWSHPRRWNDSWVHLHRRPLLLFPRHNRVSSPYRWSSGSNGNIGKEGSVIMAQG